MKRSHSFALRAAEPVDWMDIIAQDKSWSRLPIPLTGKVSDASPWHYDPATGILHCAGDQAGHEWYRFDQEFSNFDFHFEVRFLPLTAGVKKYNSGVFVRNSKDGAIWHQAQVGDASGGYFFGNTVVNGNLHRVNLQSEMLNGDLVKPAGEWNVFDLRADHAKLTLSVNGKVSSIMDCQVASGFVGLEAEGYAIDFRNVKIKALSPRS